MENKQRLAKSFTILKGMNNESPETDKASELDSPQKSQV